MDGVPSPLSTVASAVPIAASVAAGPGARGMRRPPRRGATASGNRFAQSMPVQQAPVKMVRELPVGAETSGWGRSGCFVQHMPVRQAAEEFVTQPLSVRAGV